MAVVLVLIEIVGSHDGPSAAFLYGGTESRQVNLVKGAVTDNDIHLMTEILVVVQGIVLHAGSHATRLQALNIGHHHARGQPRVFAHILEVAPA